MAEFIDDIGAKRHTMSNAELSDLYRKLDDFIADCTTEEARQNREALNAVKTMIHQRMRANK